MKTVENDWDKLYQLQTHLSIWPWSDVVSLVKRRRFSPGANVLELGVGAGANIPFFLHEKFNYWAVDASSYIVEQLTKSYPDLAGKIFSGDFTKGFPASVQFDLILDRAAMPYNPENEVRRSIDFIWENLKPGGFFIGIDWYSDQHGDRQYGQPVPNDARGKSHFEQGCFAGTTYMQFFDEAYLRDIFSRFEWVWLEHKKYQQYEPETKSGMASWNLVVRKPDA